MKKRSVDMEGRLRPLYILQILRGCTDEEHFLSTPQICEKLKEQYGIEAHRITVKQDILALQKAGFAVQETRSRQNMYNYIEREFDLPQIKLLIDAVLSSKFITKAKSEELTSRLTELAGPFRSGELRRNLVADGRYKAENEHIYLILDAINDAINRGRKICFQMTEYNGDRERVLHNGGEEYVFSPYSLVWDGDFYYVVGWSDKYGAIGSHRVDRIYRRPDVLDEPAVPPDPDFDINRCVNTMFRMYSAPRQQVTLLAEDKMMDAVIDKFGPDADTEPCGDGCFRLTATVAVGTVFYNWIFGFDGGVKILQPDAVRLEYENRVLKAAMRILQGRDGER